MDVSHHTSSADPTETATNQITVLIKDAPKVMQLCNHAIYRSHLYARPNDVTYTYVRMMDVPSYLHKLLFNDYLRDGVMRHLSPAWKVSCSSSLWDGWPLKHWPHRGFQRFLLLCKQASFYCLPHCPLDARGHVAKGPRFLWLHHSTSAMPLQTQYSILFKTQSAPGCRKK